MLKKGNLRAEIEMIIAIKNSRVNTFFHCRDNFVKYGYAYIGKFTSQNVFFF